MEFYLHFNLDMDRSPGFGSNTTDFIRPIQTRSRCGSGPEVLNLASYIHSPDHSTKGTRSPIDGLSVLVSTRQLVVFIFRLRGSHTLWLAFPCHSTRLPQYRMLSEPRKYYYLRFGLFRVRSPLLAESRLISLPRPT